MLSSVDELKSEESKLFREVQEHNPELKLNYSYAQHNRTKKHGRKYVNIMLCGE
jgi:hypothetical protein